jgi:transcriptional regulator with PAS, ATPase and Fis domain
LAEAVDRAARPVYLLDANRRVVYCNSACLEWLGVSGEGLLGQRLDYVAPSSDSAACTSGLCPPPAAFAGEVSEGTVWVTREDTVPVRYRAQFLSLPGEPEGAGRMLVVVGAPVEVTSVRPDDAPSRDSARLHDQLLRYSAGVELFMRVDPLVGISPLIKRVHAQVRLAAREADRVLIVGPPGSGHEVIARSIHEAARRREDSRLFPLDCSLLDADLLQTAVDAFIRRVAEPPERGTATLLLLDVDQLPRDAQQRLFNLISGSSIPLRTMATASDELTGQQGFRADLATALSTMTIRLPPLVERLEDLPLLVQWLLERANRQQPRQVEGVTPEAFDRLLNHPWRGNLDELAEVIEAAHRGCSSTMVHATDLPASLQLTADAERYPPRAPPRIQLDKYLGAIERELIERALSTAAGNRAQAARLLGIQRTRLLRRIAALGLDT